MKTPTSSQTARNRKNTRPGEQCECVCLEGVQRAALTTDETD